MTEAPAARIAPLPDFLEEAGLRAVLAALPRARMVGGCVRDARLGRPVADVDLATPDAPEAVMAALRAAGLKAVPTGLAHGTVTAVAMHRGFEVTTLRHELATDGRHAVVEFTEDWQADAARRVRAPPAQCAARGAAGDAGAARHRGRHSSDGGHEARFRPLLVRAVTRPLPRCAAPRAAAALTRAAQARVARGAPGAGAHADLRGGGCGRGGRGAGYGVQAPRVCLHRGGC